MRYIIYGVGAIGGVLAGKLSAAGNDVVGIARGPQLQALQSHGLLLKTPHDDIRVRFPAFGDPSEAALAPDDVILLCVKSQDTAAALLALRAAGATTQPIVCAQNGVANEPMALRLFPNVYGMMVVLPGTFITPGQVAGFGLPKAGFFDIGRYPGGIDDTTTALCAGLDAAGFGAFPQQRVMDSKYGKLLMNLSNVIDAAAGEAARSSALGEAPMAEGRAVLDAAGIAHINAGADPRRQALMQPKPIPGVERVGSSSAQSLARGVASIETDYLNGEIVLLGRLNGVPTPINQRLCALGARLIAERRRAGSLSLAEVEAFVGR